MTDEQREELRRAWETFKADIAETQPFKVLLSAAERAADVLAAGLERLSKWRNSK